MAESVMITQEIISNDNSTKEFLILEKNCETFKDSDEEIKMIFNEIKKLSNTKNKDTEIGEDVDDVELILRRAEDIAHETENILKSSPIATVVNGIRPYNDTDIPHIKVTKPNDNEMRTVDTKTGKEKVRTFKINKSIFKYNFIF
ncbi:unnamed protein product [Euphydryas editha]|uniref:Uncharacterized protein n=1 Tax=Euphydryas editha TaxID=104508 RepID=A0AAU9U550_EUPED|nr:unnamed protein product [Euphydryas editha]